LKGIEIFLLLIGGMIGIYLRYRLVSSQVELGPLSVNILRVNIIGSFALGAFSILALSWNLDARYALFVALGFCGSFTTMSSFALETVNLMDNNQFGMAAVNILANVSLSLGAIIAGRSVLSVLLEWSFR
jgi:CrcB protein